MLPLAPPGCGNRLTLPVVLFREACHDQERFLHFIGTYRRNIRTLRHGTNKNETQKVAPRRKLSLVPRPNRIVSTPPPGAFRPHICRRKNPFPHPSGMEKACTLHNYALRRPGHSFLNSKHMDDFVAKPLAQEQQQRWCPFFLFCTDNSTTHPRPPSLRDDLCFT